MVVSFDSIVDTFSVQRDSLADSFVEQSWGVWQSMSPADWWNDAVVLGVAARNAQLYSSLVEAARRLGVSYADRVLADGGVKPASKSVDSFILPRSNVSPLQEMMRPASSYRKLAVKSPTVRPASWDTVADSDRETVEGWLSSGLDRLRGIATTDVVQSSNMASLQRFKDSGVTAYRRVPHPELSESGSCGLCIAAATREYSIRDLMPLHARCKCGVAVITKDNMPSQEQIERILAMVYGDSGSTKYRDLVETRYKIGVNSELGPVLVPEGESYAHGEGEWQYPDRVMTVTQMRRIVNHYKTFADAYETVARTGQSLRLRIDGRTYHFKPGAHVEQAARWYRQYIEQVSSLFALAG